MLEETKKTERIHSVDLLKFIALSLVLLYHEDLYQWNYSRMDQLFTASGFFCYFCSALVSACVPLFFFINGYLLLNRSFDLKRHILKCVKIVFLCFVWAAILLVIMMLWKGERLSSFEFLKNIWTFHPNGWVNHLWYLGAIACIYVFFPLLKNAYDTNRKIFCFFVAVTAFFTFGNVILCYGETVLRGILGNGHIISDTNRMNMFNPFSGFYAYSLVYFCVGGLAHTMKEKILQISPLKRSGIAVGVLLICSSALSILGLYFSRMGGERWDIVWYGYDTVFTFCNVCAIYVLSLSYRKERLWIRMIAQNTLGIYLIHNVFFRMTEDFVGALPFGRTLPGNFIYIWAVMVVCLGITLAAKKVPVLRQLFML